MEASILTATQKYAAAGLFALALHQSLIHQARPYNPLLPALEDEPIGQGSIVEKSSSSVSDNPPLWIQESSGLLFPVFRVIGVDEKAWDGLKETAGSSSQLRHHVGAFLDLLSEEREGNFSRRVDKELALTKTVDATLLGMQPKVTDPQAETQSTTLKTATEDGSQDEAECEISEKAVEEGKLLSYQRKVTILYELLSACVADTAEDRNMLCPPKKGYDARHRVALRLLAAWLGIEWREMEAMEVMVSCSMMAIARGNYSKEDENRTSESLGENWKRGGIIGAAALTGGALMAVTGGLAAPAIASGLGALAPALGTIVPAIGTAGFASAAGALGSIGGSVAVAASFGAAGAGLVGSKMAKRVGDIDEFEFKEVGQNHNQGRLAVGILVSGLVFEDEDFLKPWQNLDDNLERYVVKWESQNLIALSTAIQDWLTSKVALGLMKEGAMLTVLSTLVTALALPATLVSASDLIDNKWAVALDRSDKAGKLLAEVLLKGLQGNRPVTLVGFSLGARVIFKCLQSLSEAGGAGLVERTVILGAPVAIQEERWEDIRKMVAGRFVNVYSTRDWTLGVVFRASLLSKGLAGIQPVEIPGIENVDVTEFIDGHASYIGMTKEILGQLELDNYHPTFRNMQMHHAKSQEEEEKDSRT